MKIGALFFVPLATALVLFPSHQIPADPPALKKTYQKSIKNQSRLPVFEGQIIEIMEKQIKMDALCPYEIQHAHRKT